MSLLTSRVVSPRTGFGRGMAAWLLPVLVLGAVPLFAQSRSEYLIGPRDLLVVQVFGEPTVSGNFRVEADGSFSFPLIGRVQAGQRTLRQVEDDIRQQLANGFFRDPQVNVTIQEYGSQKLFVVGEVRTPGSYPLSGEMTLLSALALAGGALPTAGDTVLVIRPSADRIDAPALPDESEGDVLVRVSLRDLQTGLAGVQNVHLQHGDTLFVPKVETVFVTGNVRVGGSFPFQKGLTVLQAIALAGGVTDRGSASRVRIMRTVDGVRTEIKAKPSDLVQPGDTVLVLERFF